MGEAATALATTDIELANAHGPYSHGTWVGDGIVIGDEEALKGRGDVLVGKICASIKQRFSADELQRMTLVDIGCYDGWITCQLAKALPLRRVIGVEPRRKNIDKGRMVRKMLGIETRCEFRTGSLENITEVLQGGRADIVICVGVLHHVPSLADGVARLHTVCARMIFIETICLPHDFEDERLRRQLELKDLPYKYLPPVCGITGHKFESGYYDGSATGLSVVSNPSVSAIRMFLDVQGFRDVRVVGAPDEYSRSVVGGLRRAAAVCVTAMVDPDWNPTRQVAEWIEDYEGGLVRTLLPRVLTETLFSRIEGRGRTSASLLAFVSVRAMSADGWILDFFLRLLRTLVPDRHAFEILRNLRYSPRDKIRVEMGKLLLARGDHAAAEQLLAEITQRLNADWRAVYRAFCLLAWSRRARGDAASARRYEDLCRLANPQFPAGLLADSPASFRAISS